MRGGEATIGLKMSRLVYRLIGFIALGLAVLGAILPVLPTTVFVLLAAWAFARSSPKLHATLLSHHRFGPVLRDWEQHGAIPRSAKIAAIVGMGISLTVVIVFADGWVIPTLTGLVLAASASYVLSRPAPPTGRRPLGEESGG
jgi:uncharacterized membrane protein YbaN (DUF454 family)